MNLDPLVPGSPDVKFLPALLSLLLQLFLQHEQLSRSLINRVLLPHTGVPATVEPLPELDVPHTGGRQQHRLIPGPVEGVHVQRDLRIDHRPERHRSLLDSFGDSLPLAAEEESSEPGKSPKL